MVTCYARCMYCLGWRRGTLSLHYWDTNAPRRRLKTLGAMECDIGCPDELRVQSNHEVLVETENSLGPRVGGLAGFLVAGVEAGKAQD